jgi:hypothetical protein
MTSGLNWESFGDAVAQFTTWVGVFFGSNGTVLPRHPSIVTKDRIRTIAIFNWLFHLFSIIT